MRYALIRITTGTVENLIELEPGSNWPVPDGFEVVASDTAGIGMNYANGVFTVAIKT
jgi:hypothetical protein